MSQDLSVSAEPGCHTNSGCTLQEILSQPLLWPVTLESVRSASDRLQLQAKLQNARVLLTGAGTSAYAASAITAAWPRAFAIPTTDLLVDAERYLLDVDAVISLSRSGDSAESAAVVERVRFLRPDILQLAIVCNKDGALSRSGLDGLILLDPRTNDKSLVMTSSFPILFWLDLFWLNQTRSKPMFPCSASVQPHCCQRSTEYANLPQIASTTGSSFCLHRLRSAGHEKQDLRRLK